MARKRSARQIRRERRGATRAVALSDQAHAESEIADPPRTDETAGPPVALSRGDAPAALGLALPAAVVYFPALSGGFVWDDVIVAEEPVIHRWSGL